MLKGYEFTEDGAESVQRVMEQMSKSEDLFDTLYSQDENFHKKPNGHDDQGRREDR